MTARKSEQRPTRTHAARQVRPMPPMSELLASCAAADAVSRPPSGTSSEASADAPSEGSAGAGAPAEVPADGNAPGPAALPRLPVNLQDKGAA